MRNKIFGYILALLLLCTPGYCRDILDGYLYDEFELTGWNAIGTPNVSATNTARIYYNGTSDDLQLSLNGGAYSPLVTTGSGIGLYLTLDQTIPQTILNGAPIFNAGLQSNDRVYYVLSGAYADFNNVLLNDVMEISDGTWTVKIVDYGGFHGIATSSAVNSFYCQLQNSLNAAEFGDGDFTVKMTDGTYAFWTTDDLDNVVKLSDGTYAINAAGNSLFTGDITVTNAVNLASNAAYGSTVGLIWAGGSKLVEQTAASGAADRMLYFPNGDWFDVVTESGGAFIASFRGPLAGTYPSTITLCGKVGIASTVINPSFELDIQKDPTNNTWFGLNIDDTSGASPAYGNAKLGVMNAADSSYSIGGLWMGADTPSFTNYAFMGDGSTYTLFNTPAGAYMAFRVGNATKWTINSSGNLVSGADGTGTQNIITKGTLTASNESFSAGAYALRSAGGNPCIQVDFERASGGFAGNFFEIWASDTTSAATALLGQVGLYGSFNADPAAPTAAWIYFSCTNSATMYLDAPLLVLPDNSVRINGDNTKLGFGAAGITDSYILYDAAQLEFYSVLGGYDFTTAANVDLTLNFIGTTNSGQFKWMEDENYFQFTNKIVIPDGAYNNPQMSFASDTNSGWYYSGDGIINWSSNGNNCASIGGGSNGYFITGANEIKLWRNAADDLRIDVHQSGVGLKTILKMAYNALTIGNGLAGTDYSLTFDGETNDGVFKWMEYEDYFDFLDGVRVAGYREAYVAKTDTYTATANDDVITCTGTKTITLPASSGLSGKVFTIKNIGTGVITVDGNGAETIDGASAYVIRTTYSGIRIISDNSGWLIVGAF